MDKKQKQLNKQKAFKLISEERMALWAGAGLSVYAGYPKGQDLANLLWKEILKRNKRTDLPLAQIADECIIASGRNELIRTLKGLYSKKPKTNSLHKVISSIPHFNTIITTNYDTLFEDTLEEGCNIIVSDSDLAYYDNRKRSLFKIHGDLKMPDSIIISSADYNNALVYRLGGTYYSTVQTKLIEHHILYIGYSLSDPNINMMLDKIAAVLGQNSKESFFVSPNISIDNYAELKRRNIIPIESTAEDFLTELTSFIKSNIVGDFKKKLVSPQVFHKFLENHDLSAQVSQSVRGNHIHGIQPFDVKKNTLGMLQITGDNRMSTAMTEFINNACQETIEISSKNGLKTFCVNDINLLDNDGSKIIIFKRPVFKDNISISFADGHEHNDIPFEAFNSNGKFWAKAQFNDALFKVQHKEGTNTFDIKFQRNDGFSTPRNEIQNLETLIRFSKGVEFNVFSAGKSLKGIQPKGIGKDIHEMEGQLRLFKNLIKIEKQYNIRFGKINSFSDQDEMNVFLLARLIDDGYLEVELEPEMEAMMHFNDPIELNLILKGERSLIIENNGWNVVVICGQALELGYECIEIPEVKILNPDEVELYKDCNVVFQGLGNTGRKRYFKERLVSLDLEQQLNFHSDRIVKTIL